MYRTASLLISLLSFDMVCDIIHAISDNNLELPTWESVKQVLRTRNNKLPTFDEGEIWWCAVGENIGVEINGKSRKYSRPVLILKKYNNYSFMGLPLTTHMRVDNRFVNFQFQHKTSTAMIIQARTMAAERLYTKMGTLPNKELQKIKIAFAKYFKT